MNSLKANIETLRRIDRDYGSIDAFVIGGNPDEIAGILSDARSQYKLTQIGLPLALEYLRNLGIRAGKPDLHIRRVLSHERLRYFDHIPTEKEAYIFIDRFARESGENPTYVDNLLWMYCATNYGNICSANPKCGMCGFRDACSYPTT